MSVPPPYPRVPHLDASRAATPDDELLRSDESRALLAGEVLVEEKLDGMNVMVWVQDGVPRVGTRGGADTIDRSGERGRIRGWVLAHGDAVRAALGPSLVLYGEWLRRRHAVPYDALPAPLVGFDVFDRDSGRFLAPDERDRVLRSAGVTPPPLMSRGRVGSVDDLRALLGRRSAFGGAIAEGLVVRSMDGCEPRVAKLVDPAYVGIGAHPWEGVNTGSAGMVA